MAEDKDEGEGNDGKVKGVDDVKNRVGHGEMTPEPKHSKNTSATHPEDGKRTTQGNNMSPADTISMSSLKHAERATLKNPIPFRPERRPPDSILLSSFCFTFLSTSEFYFNPFHSLILSKATFVSRQEEKVTRTSPLCRGADVAGG
jgi:hypothetical protein